jgi:hypothetical protein
MKELMIHVERIANWVARRNVTAVEAAQSLCASLMLLVLVAFMGR